MSASSPALPGRTAPPALHDVPFLGRDALLAQAERLLHERLPARGGLFGLEGENGAGKSRAAWALVRMARKRGMAGVMLSCRGSEIRPSKPLAFLAAAVLQVDPDLSARQKRALIEERLTALGLDDRLAEVLNLLSLRVSDSSQAQTVSTGPLHSPYDTLVLSGSESLPGQVAALVATWLRAEGRSLLVAFDDLDEASEMTQALCLELCRLTINLPLCVAATFTPTVTPGSLHTVFAEDIYSLPPLTEQVTAALTAVRLNASLLSSEMQDLVWERTQGSPLAIYLLSRHLQNARYLQVDPDSRKASLVGVYTVPAVEEMVVGRARRLPEGQRATLHTVAVLGDGARIGAIGALRDEREIQVVEQLVALIDDGWLEATGTGRKTVYRFAHRRVCELVYDDIPPDDLADLHLHAGDYYAVPGPGGRLRVIPALDHYQNAHQAGRALAVINMALDRTDPADRERQIWLYQRGAQIARLDDGQQDRQAAYAEKLGDLYAAAGDYASAFTAYDELMPEIVPNRIHSKAALVLIAVDLEAAVNALSRLIPRVRESAPHDLLWRLKSGLSVALALRGRSYEAIRIARDALAELSNTAGLGGARTITLGTIGLALHLTGETEEARTPLEQARGGWFARGYKEGVMLIDLILADPSQEEVVQNWLRFLLTPLLTQE